MAELLCFKTDCRQSSVERNKDTADDIGLELITAPALPSNPSLFPKQLALSKPREGKARGCWEGYSRATVTGQGSPRYDLVNKVPEFSAPITGSVQPRPVNGESCPDGGGVWMCAVVATAIRFRTA